MMFPQRNFLFNKYEFKAKPVIFWIGPYIAKRNQTQED